MMSMGEYGDNSCHSAATTVDIQNILKDASLHDRRLVEATKREKGRRAAVRERVVVGGLLRLEQEYDPRQLWLPFVVALVSHADKPAKKQKTPKTPKAATARKITEKRIQPIGSDNWLYVYEKGVHQEVLPFAEGALVKLDEFDRLAKTSFPCWECKVNNHRPYSLGGVRSMVRKKMIAEWAKTMANGRVAFGTNRVYFQKKSDFAMARLMFQWK